MKQFAGTLIRTAASGTGVRLTGIDLDGDKVTVGVEWPDMFRLVLAGMSERPSSATLQMMSQETAAAPAPVAPRVAARATAPAPVLKLPMQYRNGEVLDTEQRSAADKEVFRVRFSSEVAVERFFGMEILDHGPESVDLSFATRGGPVFVNHDTADHVGVIEAAEIGGDRAGYARIRFSKSARGREIRQDVLDGIRRYISVGYRIEKMRQEGTEAEKPVYRVTRWKVHEVSVVGVPADETAAIAA